MLRTADRDWYDVHDADVPMAVWPPSPDVRPPAVQPARYGDDRRPRFGTALTVLLIHAVVIGALLYFRPTVVREEVARLQVVNVKLTPPSPPKEPAKTPKPEVVKLAPTVQAPQTTVVSPIPPPAISLSVAAPTPAAAAPAPPAPEPAPAPPLTTVQGGDLGTQMLSGRPPRYPVESRRKHEEGTVVLDITLGMDGRVASIAIARSSGSARLDNAARDAVKSWRWAPTIRNGVAVMVRGVVEIPFVLQG